MAIGPVAYLDLPGSGPRRAHPRYHRYRQGWRDLYDRLQNRRAWRLQRGRHACRVARLASRFRPTEHQRRRRDSADRANHPQGARPRSRRARWRAVGGNARVAWVQLIERAFSARTTIAAIVAAIVDD